MSAITILRLTRLNFVFFLQSIFDFNADVSIFGRLRILIHLLSSYYNLTHILKLLYTNLGLTFPKDKDFIPETIFGITSLERLKIYKHSENKIRMFESLSNAKNNVTN